MGQADVDSVFISLMLDAHFNLEAELLTKV